MIKLLMRINGIEIKRNYSIEHGYYYGPFVVTTRDENQYDVTEFNDLNDAVKFCNSKTIRLAS
jgi:hypothetical protein